MKGAAQQVGFIKTENKMHYQDEYDRIIRSEYKRAVESRKKRIIQFLETANLEQLKMVENVCEHIKDFIAFRKIFRNLSKFDD